jgi:hypothetical protein
MSATPLRVFPGSAVGVMEKPYGKEEERTQRLAVK